MNLLSSVSSSVKKNPVLGTLLFSTEHFGIKLFWQKKIVLENSEILIFSIFSVLEGTKNVKKTYNCLSEDLKLA